MPSVEQQEIILNVTKIVVVAYIVTSLLFDTVCAFKTPPPLYVTMLVILACAALMFVDGVLAALILIGYICLHIQCLSKDYFRKKVEKKIENYQNMIGMISVADINVDGEDVTITDGSTMIFMAEDVMDHDHAHDPVHTDHQTSCEDKVVADEALHEIATKKICSTSTPFLEEVVKGGGIPVTHEVHESEYDDPNYNEFNDMYAKVDFPISGTERIFMEQMTE